MKYLLFTFVCLFLPCLIETNPTDLDTSFNEIGYLTAVLGDPYSKALSITMQSDEKIVATGYSYVSETVPQLLLARYNTDGSLDSTFGTDGQGYVITTIGTAGLAQSVSLQSDGKIVVSGYATISSVNYVIIARYTSDGILDDSFNPSGNISGMPGVVAAYVTSQFLNPARYVYNIIASTIQDDGNIVIAATINNNQILGARFLTDGSVDTSFGISASGFNLLSLGGNAQASAIALQSDGTIIIVGNLVVSGNTSMLVLSLTSDGLLNTIENGGNGFGAGSPAQGYTTLLVGTSPSYGRGIALYAHNNIIVTGSCVNGIQQAIIACYTADGILNRSFNEVGYNTLNIASSTNLTAISPTIIPTGQISISGNITTPSLGNSIFIARYNADGSIDTTINPSGYFITNLNNSSTITYAQIIKNDGKIMVGGQADGFFNFMLARFLGGIISKNVLPTISTYGYNSNFFSEFLYINSYAQVITNPTAQAATIATTENIVATYSTTYVNQPNFNYINYLYLIQSELKTAQAILVTTYPESSMQINQFFYYINKRILELNPT